MHQPCSCWTHMSVCPEITKSGLRCVRLSPAIMDAIYVREEKWFCSVPHTWMEFLDVGHSYAANSFYDTMVCACHSVNACLFTQMLIVWGVVGYFTVFRPKHFWCGFHVVRRMQTWTEPLTHSISTRLIHRANVVSDFLVDSTATDRPTDRRTAPRSVAHVIDRRN